MSDSTDQQLLRDILQRFRNYWAESGTATDLTYDTEQTIRAIELMVAEREREARRDENRYWSDRYGEDILVHRAALNDETKHDVALIRAGFQDRIKELENDDA